MLTNEWLFECQLYEQIKFCMHSIMQINRCKSKPDIFLAYYIQNLLSSLGNIAKVLNNNKNSQTKQRCVYLRKYLGVDIAKIPNITNLALRNTSEHIDERFDLVKGSQHSGGISFTDYPIGNIKKKQNTERLYIVKDKIISYTDRDYNVHQFHLPTIRKELTYLKNCKGLRYIFNRYKECDKEFSSF